MIYNSKFTNNHGQILAHSVLMITYLYSCITKFYNTTKIDMFSELRFGFLTDASSEFLVESESSSKFSKTWTGYFVKALARIKKQIGQIDSGWFN